MQKQAIEERARRSINFNAKIQQKKQSNIRLPVLAQDRNPYVKGPKKSNVTIDIMIFFIKMISMFSTIIHEFEVLLDLLCETNAIGMDLYRIHIILKQILKDFN